MVTHDLKRASSYADDIWVLEDGKVNRKLGKETDTGMRIF